MKKFCFVLFFILMASAPGFPVGFGVYGTGGGGQVDVLTLHSNNDYTVRYSMKHAFYGGGLLIESGTNAEEGYHNRISFGMEGISTFGGRYDYRRLFRAHITNVFAFRIAGSEKFRLWMGPLIGLHIITGLGHTSRHDTWDKDKNRLGHLLTAALEPNLQPAGFYYHHFSPVWERTYGVFVPIGAALGANIRLAESASMTVEGGFRCGLYYLTKTGFDYEGYLNAGFVFGAI